MHHPFHRFTLGVTLAAALGGLGTAAHAQSETLLTKQSTSLREQPASNAGSVATLAAGTAVTRTPQRVGPWMQVQTANGQQGWVHMFDLTAASSAGAPANNGLTGALRGLTGFLNRGSSGSTTVATSTVGIRGLSKEDIQNAAPNTAGVEKLEHLRADDTQARRFAAEKALTVQSVQPLPAPAQVAVTAPSRENSK